MCGWWFTWRILPFFQFLSHFILVFSTTSRYNIRTFSKTQILKKQKWCHLNILMHKLSFRHLYWIETQYIMVNMYLKKVKNTTTKNSIHYIALVHCELWKNILYIVKSAKIHELRGGEGFLPLDSLPGLCPGPTRDFKRPPHPFIYITSNHHILRIHNLYW